MTDAVQVSETIAAPPLMLYGLVSDVTRMGEWSPETTSCRWLGGATGAVVGVRFVGTNQRGVFRYRTTCTVTAADPGRRFAFSVHFGPISVADWAYDFRATRNGCEVTESWHDRRAVVLRIAAPILTATPNRPEHNRRGMQKTLAALKATAEATAKRAD